MHSQAPGRFSWRLKRTLNVALFQMVSGDTIEKVVVGLLTSCLFCLCRPFPFPRMLLFCLFCFFSPGLSGYRRGCNQLHMSSINAARSQRLAQPNSGKQTEFIAFGACLALTNGFQWLMVNGAFAFAFCLYMLVSRSAAVSSLVSQNNLSSQVCT